MGKSLEVVNQFYDLTNNRRTVDGMEQLIAQDMVFCGPLQSTATAAEYIALNQRLLQFHAGVKMLQQFEAGDNVCSIYELKVRTPGGEVLNLPMSDWIRVVGGRIAEQRIYYDPREFGRAFGM